jgi:hypothetical protein
MDTPCNDNPPLPKTKAHRVADESLRKALWRLVSDLGRVDLFYNSIGGLIGYQCKCLEVLRRKEEESDGMQTGSEVLFHLPQGPNLADDRRVAAQAAATGLEALPHMAEIYPVGGMQVQAPLSSMIRQHSAVATLWGSCLWGHLVAHAV